MVEKAQINTAIKNLEDEKKELAQLLGMNIYDAFIENREVPKEEIISFCNEIRKKEALIAGQQEKLNRIDAEAQMTTAPERPHVGQCSCGSANAEGAKFCGNCGSPL